MAEVDGRHLGERRLAEPDRPQPPLVEQVFEPVEEDVAPRLADVEQADDLPLEGGGPVGQGPSDRGPLAGGVEEDTHLGVGGGSQGLTSLVTGMLPIAPRTQPPMTAENRPAPPPAWTISSPSGRNFGMPASPEADAGPTGPTPVAPEGQTVIPSAQPWAPATSSDIGFVPSSMRRARSRAFDQPAS